MLDRVGKRADQPIPAEPHRHLAGFRGRSRELARVIEALRVLEAMIESEAVERGLDTWERPAGTAVAGAYVHDQRQRHVPVTSSWRSSAIATGSGSMASSASDRVV